MEHLLSAQARASLWAQGHCIMPSPMADNARLILDELLAELEERRKKVLLGGGEERIQRQHQQGKLTARERIDHLLDPGSFVELMPFAEHLETGLMEGLEAPADGVVTGYGTIGGRTVFVFSQDFTVLGGSLGKMHGRKIASLMDLAAKVGAPSSASTTPPGPASRRGWTASRATGRSSTATPSTPGWCPRSPPSWAPAPGARSTAPP